MIKVYFVPKKSPANSLEKRINVNMRQLWMLWSFWSAYACVCKDPKTSPCRCPSRSRHFHIDIRPVSLTHATEKNINYIKNNAGSYLNKCLCECEPWSLIFFRLRCLLVLLDTFLFFRSSNKAHVFTMSFFAFFLSVDCLALCSVLLPFFLISSFPNPSYISAHVYIICPQPRECRMRHRLAKSSLCLISFLPLPVSMKFINSTK